MYCRAIRGATTVKENTVDEILSATKELLAEMIAKNDIKTEDLSSIFFSVTKDLDATFPAKGARHMGLDDTPLFCMQEIPVQNSMEKCIRILIHVNTLKSNKEIKHCYLGEAKELRPDQQETAPQENRQ